MKEKDLQILNDQAYKKNANITQKITTKQIEGLR
jgi:hypothetical protein